MLKIDDIEHDEHHYQRRNKLSDHGKLHFRFDAASSRFAKVTISCSQCFSLTLSCKNKK